MKKIRNRTRPDRLETDIRKARRTIGRRIYIVLLTLFFIFVAYQLFGGRYVLRADAVIYRESVLIDAPYEMHITKAFARRGDSVSAGDVLFEADIVDPIFYPQFETGLLDTGWSVVKGGGAQALAETGAFVQPVTVQLKAKFDGVLGEEEFREGEVFLAGETIATLFHGDYFAHVFLPEEHRFEIPIGEKIRLEYGNLEAEGMVSQILPVSMSMPLEFRGNIQAIGRNAVLRVEIQGETKIPLLQLIRAEKKNHFLLSLFGDSALVNRIGQ